MAVLASKAWMPRKSSYSAFGRGGAGLPGGAVVGGSEDCALRAAGPCNSVASGLDATEAGGGVGLLDGPLGWGGDGEGQEDQGEAHGLVVRSSHALCGLRSRSRLHEREHTPRAKARSVGRSRCQG